jgi:putative transcriptional regulator
MARKRILDAVHETATGFHEAGVMDTKTMREFDALCLPPVKNLSAAQIKRLRRNGSKVRRSPTVLR